MPEGLCQPQKGEGNGSYVPTPPPHSSTPVEKGKLLHLSEPQFPCMQTKVAKRTKGEGSSQKIYVGLGCSPVDECLPSTHKATLHLSTK